MVGERTRVNPHQTLFRTQRENNLGTECDGQVATAHFCSTVSICCSFLIRS